MGPLPEGSVACLLYDVTRCGTFGQSTRPSLRRSCCTVCVTTYLAPSCATDNVRRVPGSVETLAALASREKRPERLVVGGYPDLGLRKPLEGEAQGRSRVSYCRRSAVLVTLNEAVILVSGPRCWRSPSPPQPAGERIRTVSKSGWIAARWIRKPSSLACKRYAKVCSGLQRHV